MSKKVWIPITIALIAALFAGFWAVDVAFAEEGGPLSRLRRARAGLGQVTEITDNSFTVQKRDGNMATLLVDENTRFLDKDKNELAFSDLAVGRWVLATGARNDQGEAVARAVVILPEDFDPSLLSGVRGLVTSVDAANSLFSVQPEGEAAVTFSVNGETRFGGEVQNLEELEVGMNAWVAALEQSDGSFLAQAVRAGNRPDFEKHLGEFTAVDSTAKTFTMKTRAGEEITFAVDENTKFKSREGAVQSLDDLQPGMVGLVLNKPAEAGALPIAVVVAATPKEELPKFELRIGGRILSIDQHSFVIEARDGQQYTINVVGHTNFRSRGGQIQGIEDLEVGMAVIVGGKELGSGSIQAQLVVVLNRR